MIQTIFFDIDNTFYDHISQTIPPKHVEAFHGLKKNGYKVCVCTGRPFVLLKELPIIDQFDWDGIVCGNGAFVYDKNLKCIYTNPIDHKAANQVFEYAKKMGVSAFGLGNHKFMTQKDQKAEEIIESLHFTDIEIRQPQSDDLYSNLLIKLDSGMEPVPELDAIPGIEAIYMPNFIEIKKSHSSKYQGIQVLMDTFHENEHEFLAFGDSYIDLEMIQNAKIGVVMDNGDPRIKPYADAICPSCADGGIYTYLNQNGWL